MEQPKAIELAQAKPLVSREFLFLIAAICIFPIFHNQFFTGPMVNAMFFIALYFVSRRDTLLLAIIPSLMALAVGLLPVIILPIIPYIIISNFLLIFIFDLIRKHSFWQAVLWSSVLKFMFLYASSVILVKFFLKGDLAKAAAAMFSWPQLYSAIAGGLVAYFILKYLKRI